MQLVRIRGARFERYAVRGQVAAPGAVHSGDPGGTGVIVLSHGLDVAHRVASRRLTGGLVAGDQVTLVWLVPDGAAGGPYVAVRHEATGRVRYDAAVLARLARPSWVVPMGLAALLLGWFEWTVPVLFVVAGLALAWWLEGTRGAAALMAGGELWADDGSRRPQVRHKLAVTTWGRLAR